MSRQATAVWQTTQFLSMLDLTPAELEACLELAASLKAARRAGRAHEAPLSGRHVALLFDKPSLRTRSTFMIAVRELGGDVIEPQADVAFGVCEVAVRRAAEVVDRTVLVQQPGDLVGVAHEIGRELGGDHRVDAHAVGLGEVE